MRSDCSCLLPLTTTVTMPPPALASTRISAIRFCICSCICLACCMTDAIFMGFRLSASGSRLHFFHVADLGREHIQQRLHTTGLERFGLEISLLPFGGCCGFLLGAGGSAVVSSSLHRGHRNLAPTETLRRSFEPRARLIELLAQRTMRRQERERDAIVGDIDLLRLRNDGVVEERLAGADLGK